MTLETVKDLLNSNNIPYEICHYSGEADFYRHIILFPYVKNAKSCKVTTIVIRSKNGHKNTELQFNETKDGTVFVGLFFGGYSYELFDCQEEYLSDEIIREIDDIREGRVSVIEVNNLKKSRWIGDFCFDRNDMDDPIFGEPGFEKAMRKVQKPLSFFKKLFHAKIQYEVYDFERYQCIIKG
ncbi:MAG: hypothetical protein IKH12_00265 [Clostridia bacterium]|nr:hypothetical protein [Clostridia bacterium]